MTNDSAAPPEARIPAELTAFKPVHEVTFYQARCTVCGSVVDDYGDYSAWGDPGTPVEDVVEFRDWFYQSDDDILICPECQISSVSISQFIANARGEDE